MNDLIELLKDIASNVISLIINLYSLLGYILGIGFLIGIIYLLIIRPIWGSIYDKGKRTYWLGLILMLLLIFIIGPFSVAFLNDRYGDNGMYIGLILYIIIVLLISRPLIKKENKFNDRT